MTLQTPIITIPDHLLAEWEEVTSLIAEITGVCACLVMRGNENTMEVMARSLSDGNPYQPGEEAPRENNLYCETVIATRKPLEVVDSRTDQDWQGNPDEALGVYSYYGLPVEWPSGENFGTLCILDKAAKKTKPLERSLIQKFARLIEYSLENMAHHMPHLHAANNDDSVKNSQKVAAL